MASPERPLTFFDITIGGKPVGRIVFSLFSNELSKTTENFRVYPETLLCVRPGFVHIYLL